MFQSEKKKYKKTVGMHCLFINLEFKKQYIWINIVYLYNLHMCKFCVGNRNITYT
ncbi:hypothetical protein HanIR_Chr16g0842841 [Helianthus annuus]|nr:hypothetical protein HanIR_Chr16g0842841 [Helianthus annuus]